MKNIKFNKKILILAPIILGLFVLGGCYKQEGEEKALVNENEELIRVFEERQEEENREEKIDTSDWKTYRNDHYGYEISYPEDWEIFVRDYREPRGHTVDAMTLHIAKECDSEKLRKCPNEVVITSHKLTSMPIIADKAEDGRLPVTVSEAFHDVFTLKEGEDRESLQYNNNVHCYIYDGAVKCGYGFINNTIYFSEEVEYSIRIKDSTKERKYLKTEKAIIESLKMVKKLN
ncbi:MAG: hypothetical protein U9O20_05000 [Patescibacteria group bacterium]|nr:hypothetical protein [Patescibacteria group bacterium]